MKSIKTALKLPGRWFSAQTLFWVILLVNCLTLTVNVITKSNWNQGWCLWTPTFSDNALLRSLGPRFQFDSKYYSNIQMTSQPVNNEHYFGYFDGFYTLKIHFKTMPENRFQLFNIFIYDNSTLLYITSKIARISGLCTFGLYFRNLKR